MKISIITSTYNRLDKLKLTISSVLKQKYNNWEYFIIDDCSTDDSIEYIKNIHDKRIKFISLNENYGQPGAFFHSNVLKKITGDLIIFLDSDDVLLDLAFEKIILDFKNLKNPCEYIAYKFTDNISVPKIDYSVESKLSFFNSNEIFNDNFPLNKGNKGFVDHLFVYSSIYIKKFTNTFYDPKYWYVSRYIIHTTHSFNVAFSNTILYFMSFDNDTVTKGSNFAKYAPITLFTRKYIFENYKDYMSENYYLYSLKSYLLNLIIFPKNKSKILILILKNINVLLKSPIFLFLSLIAIFVPAKLLFYMKFFFKFSRSKR